MDLSVTLDQIKAMSVEDRIHLIQAIQDTIPDVKSDRGKDEIRAKVITSVKFCRIEHGAKLTCHRLHLAN